jgi:AraC family transcriptional regulator
MATAQLASKTTLGDYKRRLLRVLEYIQQHLDDRLELQELARVACFSSYHFHRIFTGMIGESIKGHIRRLRLERAAIELRVSTKSVVEVALDSGYEAHAAFTRAFKAAYGIAPVRFRSNKRPIAVLAAPSGVHYCPGAELKTFNTNLVGVPSMNVRIKTIEPMRVAFMRHIGPYNRVGIPHDDPEVTPSNKLRYDACVTVDDRYVATGAIKVQTIPSGDYAVTTHCGPPGRIGETYAKLFGQWLPRSGREVRSSPSFVIALNHLQVQPLNQLTDIYLPLQPKARGEAMKSRSGN